MAGEFNYDFFKMPKKKPFRFFDIPCSAGKQTDTYISIFDRSCSYQECFDGGIFYKCNC